MGGDAFLVSPASLLDSQHGCITSPHAKESGQTPYAVWSPLVQEFLGPGSGFDCCGVWFYSSLLTVRPHLLTVQDQTAYGVSPDSFFVCGDAIHPCCESRRLAGETRAFLLHCMMLRPISTFPFPHFHFPFPHFPFLFLDLPQAS